jgi:hypothetical protein
LIEIRSIIDQLNRQSNLSESKQERLLRAKKATIKGIWDKVSLPNSKVRPAEYLTRFKEEYQSFGLSNDDIFTCQNSILNLILQSME